jgi:hypothetical protein
MIWWKTDTIRVGLITIDQPSTRRDATLPLTALCMSANAPTRLCNNFDAAFAERARYMRRLIAGWNVGASAMHDRGPT